MKPGSKNMLLIGGAGIALYILMKGGDLPGGPSDIFGGKEEKGTVAGTWTGSGGESGGAAIPESFTKKDAATAAATGYTPTGYTLQDMIYQRDVEPGIVANKKGSYALPSNESLYSQQAKVDPVLADIFANQSPAGKMGYGYIPPTATKKESTVATTAPALIDFMNSQTIAPVKAIQTQQVITPASTGFGSANYILPAKTSGTKKTSATKSAIVTPNAPKAGSLASGAAATSYKQSISVKSGAPSIKTQFSNTRAW